MKNNIEPPSSDLLSSISQLAAQDGNIEILWLYGSRAEGCSHELSDYDLALAFKSWIPDPLQRRLRPELVRQQWQELLDLDDGLISIVDIALCPIPLAVNIIESAPPVLIKNPFRYTSELNRVWGLWSDSLWKPVTDHHSKQPRYKA